MSHIYAPSHVYARNGFVDGRCVCHTSAQPINANAHQLFRTVTPLVDLLVVYAVKVHISLPAVESRLEGEEGGADIGRGALCKDTPPCLIHCRVRRNTILPESASHKSMSFNGHRASLNV
eukprot:1942732-Pyramimonas_sp.AAC.1